MMTHHFEKQQRGPHHCSQFSARHNNTGIREDLQNRLKVIHVKMSLQDQVAVLQICNEISYEPFAKVFFINQV